MTTIELLENRITALEEQVYGLGKSLDADNTKVDTSVIDSILHANTLISSAVSGREKANVTIKRLPELNTYLDPVTETTEIPIDAKLQMLMTMEHSIRENYSLLTKVQELLPVLETERIRDVPEYSKKFNDLSLKYLNLYDDSTELNAHINEIFSKYNAIITSISKSLITMDAAVRAAEIAAMPKKPLD